MCTDPSFLKSLLSILENNWVIIEVINKKIVVIIIIIVKKNVLKETLDSLSIMDNKHTYTNKVF